MRKTYASELYRCDLCRGVVDADTRERARHAWQPMIICERCFVEARPPVKVRPAFAPAAVS